MSQCLGLHHASRAALALISNDVAQLRANKINHVINRGHSAFVPIIARRSLALHLSMTANSDNDKSLASTTLPFSV